jgi:hypothetical protein
MVTLTALAYTSCTKHTRSMTLDEKAGPIEVWLTQNNIEIKCMVVHEDESATYLDVDSLSMRGAQRQITADLIDQGYTPAGRWENAEDEPLIGDGSYDYQLETVRRFKVKAPQTA